MKKIMLISFVFTSGVVFKVNAQDSVMKQKPLMSTASDSGSLSSQWPATDSFSTKGAMAKEKGNPRKNSLFAYYPYANVYKNSSTNEYTYFDQVNYRWITSKQLPPEISVDAKAESYQLSYAGNDPWKENDAHKMRYKMKKDGSIKAKPVKE